MAPVIALTGFMGSGKSRVGSSLAAELGWRFVDLDMAIETVAGMSVPRFFSDHGEDAFRAKESEVLREVLATTEAESIVMALGGGTLLRDANADMVRSRGIIVYRC